MPVNRPGRVASGGADAAGDERRRLRISDPTINPAPSLSMKTYWVVTMPLMGQNPRGKTTVPQIVVQTALAQAADRQWAKQR